jgi:hypothetical protein
MPPEQLTQEGQRTNTDGAPPTLFSSFFSEANAGSIAVVIQSFFLF